MNTCSITPNTEHAIQTFIQRTDKEQLPCQFYTNGYLWHNNYNHTGKYAQERLVKDTSRVNKKLP